MANRHMTAVGPVVLAVVGVALGLVSLWTEMPWWVTALVVLATVLGVYMSFRFISPEESVPETTFIRGDVTGSSLIDVASEADVFIDGSVDKSWFERVIHRRGRG